MHEVARVEAQIRSAFVIHDKPSKLVVDFGCDAAPEEVDEVVFEDGSGHGGTLRIARFRREGAGRFSVRVIESGHYPSMRMEVKAGTATARALNGIVARSRVALVAKPHLVRLHDPASMGLGMSASFSSNDFHLRLLLSGTASGGKEAEVTERRFTGYESSGEQEGYVPMRLASEPIERFLSLLQATLAVEPPTDEDRQFFTEQLVAMLAESPAAYWWVRERYVALAAKLGTIDAVPALVGVVREGLADRRQASVARASSSALDAIEAITGWDPRVDASGGPLAPERAAAAVVEECVDAR